MTRPGSHPPMVTLAGLGVSGGIAIGRAVCIADAGDDVLRFQLDEHEIEPEVQRFEEARSSAVAELRKAQAKMGRALGTDLAGILDAQALLMEDVSFARRVSGRIREGEVNAEWAVLKECRELEDRFAEIESEYLRDRGEDLRNVSRYLLRALQGVAHHELSEIVGEVVIVARELTPSDALRFARENVVGFVLGAGGATSHTTIILRGLKLPAVVGLEGILDLVTDRDPIVVDGDHGDVVLHPRKETLQSYRGRAADIVVRDEQRARSRFVSATTLDGVEVELLANLELPEEMDDALRYGCTGVGLYRTEFFMIEKSPELPSEEDHYTLVCRVLDGLAPRPVVIRTFDLGGRKLSAGILPEDEENPVLGLRGIRVARTRPEILRPQLRALIRGAARGDLRIMVPLVTAVEEVRDFRALCDDVIRELAAEGLEHDPDVRLGAMIEVPSAAMIVDHLAREVDFLSIGTNDLIQYALAVDRNNEHVAQLYQPTHPAVLRLLRGIVEQAVEADCEISMCGEMAADPLLTPFLLGLGLRRLSMSPRSIPGVKERVRGLRIDSLAEMVERCLTAPTAGEVRACLEASHPWSEESTR